MNDLFQHSRFLALFLTCYPHYYLEGMHIRLLTCITSANEDYEISWGLPVHVEDKKVYIGYISMMLERALLDVMVSSLLFLLAYRLDARGASALWLCMLVRRFLQHMSMIDFFADLSVNPAVMLFNGLVLLLIFKISVLWNVMDGDFSF